jgi:hypothetical protein
VGIRRYLSICSCMDLNIFYFAVGALAYYQ